LPAQLESWLGGEISEVAHGRFFGKVNQLDAEQVANATILRLGVLLMPYEAYINVMLAMGKPTYNTLLAFIPSQQACLK